MKFMIGIREGVTTENWPFILRSLEILLNIMLLDTEILCLADAIG